MIGSQAIGLYQMVFPFLMVLIAIPTSGIPIAVSKLVAKENSLNNRRGIYRLLTLTLGMLVQLYCTYYLVPNPKYGINGFFIGFIASSFLIFILNLITLSKYVKLNLPFIQSILKPIFCSLITFLVIIILYQTLGGYLSSALTSVVSLGFGGLLYCGLLVITKTLDINQFINSLKS